MGGISQPPRGLLEPALIVDRILARPDAMPSADLHAFAECIHKFQAAHTAISIFNDQHIISIAILDRRACADAAKPEDITELINTDDIDPEFKLRSDISHHSTPLSSPHISPHILPVDPVNTTSIATPLLPPAQLIPPVTIPRKRKVSGPPPENIESAQPAPLYRSTRQNQLPDSRARAQMQR
jgi:hypothetical protein